MSQHFLALTMTHKVLRLLVFLIQLREGSFDNIFVAVVEKTLAHNIFKVKKEFIQ